MQARKPREAYVRVVVRQDEVECIVGLELKDTDVLETLYRAVRMHTRQAIVFLEGKDDLGYAKAIERTILTTWPERAYFLEVSHGKRQWVQVFQPWGVPRDRDDPELVG